MGTMRHRIAFALVALTVGCGPEEEPSFGDPSAIRGRSVKGVGTTAPPAAAPAGDGGGAPGPEGTPEGRANFLSTAYPVISPCGTCHVTGPGPAIMAATAEGTYSLFLSKGFAVPNSKFINPPDPHSGGPVSDAIKKAINDWVALE